MPTMTNSEPGKRLGDCKFYLSKVLGTSFLMKVYVYLLTTSHSQKWARILNKCVLSIHLRALYDLGFNIVTFLTSGVSNINHSLRRCYS